MTLKEGIDLVKKEGHGRVASAKQICDYVNTKDNLFSFSYDNAKNQFKVKGDICIEDCSYVPQEELKERKDFIVFNENDYVRFTEICEEIPDDTELQKNPYVCDFFTKYRIEERKGD